MIDNFVKWLTSNHKGSMEDLYNEPPYEAKHFDEVIKDDEATPVETKPKTFYVFVYGSLMEGFGNHRLLVNSKKIGDTYVTKKRFRMVSLGGFPMVLKANPDEDLAPSNLVRTRSLYRPIRGEVYEVDRKTLAHLDSLEGNGSFYNRELVSINNFKDKVWVYIGMGDRYRSYDPVDLDRERTYSWLQHKINLRNALYTAR